MAKRRRKGTAAGAKPGSGKNFAKLKRKFAARGARNPGALAAWIGRRKYGAHKFAEMSGAGRHRAAAHRHGR